MASIKAIRRRIASVKSTQQVTRAMKLVSAARLRRAQEALVSARPYSDALARVARSLFEGERAALAPAENAAPAVLLMVVASDRGLCGAYNSNLIRMAEQVAEQVRRDRREPRFFAVGRRAADHFRRTRQPLAGERINNTPRLATMGLARELARVMLGDYRGAKICAAGVVYSRFRSALSQQPAYEQVLPAAPPERAQGAESAPIEYLIEPSRAELVPFVVQSYVESSIFRALLEAEASDHGARMTAMDAATTNAADMIERLTLEMNRARQAAITRELMDIVGGSEALHG